MKIAFLGNGSMAAALGQKWKHHELFIAGRTPENAASLAAQIGAKTGTMSEATAYADVVVLATQSEGVFDAIEDAGGADAFKNKTVIDISNPINLKTFITTMEGRMSLTEAIAEKLPSANVAKAFNMSQARVWADTDTTYDGRNIVTLFTADDEATESIVSQLIKEVGGNPVHAGDNSHAYQLEAAGAIVIRQLFSGKPYDTVLQLIQPDVSARTVRKNTA